MSAPAPEATVLTEGIDLSGPSIGQSKPTGVNFLPGNTFYGQT